MEQRFFEQPILNSPYEYPARHWELDENRQPTNRIVDRRRSVTFITPIPAARKQRLKQAELGLDDADRTADDDGQQYELMRMIESVRHSVGEWRRLPRAQWRVTPETARLLDHWRHHQFSDIRPFFCQVEAVETVIWLTEVAPGRGREGRQFVQRLQAANEAANPGLARLAAKLATGAGKTTVMAMLIAWQTINAVRHPGSRRSGEALGKDFRAAATDEIERFRREIIARTGDRRQAESLSDQDLLREVMNTVGVADRLGGTTRCVVSVSMLTEGWDARTVTHILGVRAFGTQLLCEQVVGRALRRQSYDLNEDGVFDVEYADVLGIPFDFTAEPVVAKPPKPRATVAVRAITPDRDACEEFTDVYTIQDDFATAAGTGAL